MVRPPHLTENVKKLLPSSDQKRGILTQTSQTMEPKFDRPGGIGKSKTTPIERVLD